MQATWRFFRDEAGLWRWQQVAVSRDVLAESHTSYAEYDDCLADAKKKGYIFAAAQERTRSGAMGTALPTTDAVPAPKSGRGMTKATRKK